MPILCAACHPEKKNFVREELSRPFCGWMPSACFTEMDGRRTGRRTAMPTACFPEELSRSFCGGTRIGTPTMPSACCLLHRRRKTFFGMNFLDLFHTVCAHWQAHCYAYCLLPVEEEKLFQKNFLDLSVEGGALRQKY